MVKIIIIISAAVIFWTLIIVSTAQRQKQRVTYNNAAPVGVVKRNDQETKGNKSGIGGNVNMAKVDGENMKGADSDTLSKKVDTIGAQAIDLREDNSEESDTNSDEISEFEKTEAKIEAEYSSGVFINGHELAREEMNDFMSRYGVEPEPGNYWYDSVSGAYGYVGQPTYGIMYPGHNFGVLSPDASNGNSGVFFNGRELPEIESQAVASLFGAPPIPGRYWVDASGNLGLEGQSYPLVNLYAAVARAGGSGNGGDNFWSSSFGAGNYNAGNTQGYVSVPGYGPVGYGF